MSKQTAIEQDGVILEALSNAMFKLNYRMVMSLRLISPER